MKAFILIILLIFTNPLLAARGGDEKGNGADIIICPTKDGDESYACDSSAHLRQPYSFMS